jgi:hypothetical protein
VNDKAAKESAARICEQFWSDFERALDPKHASKRAYLEELEELVCEAKMRIDCIRDELKEEG